MFSLFEKIKNLAKSKGISLNKVEEDLGFSQNYLYALKTKKPTADKLELLADYFGVTTDYLLGRQEDDTLQRFFRIDMSKYNPEDREYIEKELEEFHNLLMQQIEKKRRLKDEH